ncbi:MAG TPA: hypothetical protein VK191_11630, partial [Symbiobacteriaceae bacterium]|nr:hypothetical protein [Symbiobacteriaceae bacterium]
DVKTWVKTNDYFAGNRVEQGGDVFVPSNNKYPHIHIGNDFVTYSKSSSNHIYLIQGDQVFKGRIQTAQQDSQDAHVIQVCRYLDSQY